MWTTAARIATPKKGVSGDMAVAAKLCLTTELRKVSTLGISTENRFGWRGVARACAAQVAVYGQRGGGRVTLRSPHDSSYTLRCPWRKGTEENYRWFVFFARLASRRGRTNCARNFACGSTPADHSPVAASPSRRVAVIGVWRVLRIPRPLAGCVKFT